MARISLGRPRPRPCSGEKVLRRCTYNKEADDVILIDVDSEKFEKVIIIDTPESLPPKKNEGSSMLREDKCPLRNVINLDDDEIHDSSHFVGADKARFSAGTSSSRDSVRVAQNCKDSADAAVEDYQFVQDKGTPFRLSKCKRTYSGNYSRSNRYGLYSDAECDSSDDDDLSDCEIVEDISGKVQEQWEKAFSRRRKDINNVGTSHVINKDYHQNAISKDETRQHKETSSFSPDKSIDEIDEIDAQAFYRKKVDTDFGCTHLSDDTIVEDKESPKVGPSLPKPVEEDFCIGNYHRNAKSNDATWQHKEASSFSPDGSINEIDEIDAEDFYREKVDTDFGCSDGSSGPSNFEEDSFIGNSGPTESEATKCKEYHQNAKSKFETRQHKEASSFSPGKSMEEIDEIDAHDFYRKKVDTDLGCTHLSDDMIHDQQNDGASGPSKSEATKCKSKSSFELEINQRRSFPKDNHGNVQETATRIVEERNHFGSNRVTEANLQQDGDSVSNIHQQEDKDDLPTQNGDTQETCIISEREKLKETDEYKRADEEEWASRQQALQIQSEEARRLRQLRKRKRAESIRLLDMKRRQKERIEEVRNIQKKDEENMSLKETIRGEVRNELKILETKCKNNMASLLHLLGIQVGSWPNSSPQEVQAAYKRAMFTFHPDRAPQSDIRKQVEAEEKFKLVNRIKEKLCLQGKWVST